jgi:hypothetical protein
MEKAGIAARRFQVALSFTPRPIRHCSIQEIARALPRFDIHGRHGSANGPGHRSKGGEKWGDEEEFQTRGNGSLVARHERLSRVADQPFRLAIVQMPGRSPDGRSALKNTCLRLT